MQGYGGRILFVDVDERIELASSPSREELARSLLGGNGFAARLLLDHVPAGVDAYDPANAVIFAVGPVTDTTVPGNSRALRRRASRRSPGSSSTRPSAGAGPPP